MVVYFSGQLERLSSEADTDASTVTGKDAFGSRRFAKQLCRVLAASDDSRRRAATATTNGTAAAAAAFFRTDLSKSGENISP
jgi:hypothetical protein